MLTHRSPRRQSNAAFALGAVVLTVFVLGLTSYHLWRLRSQALDNGLQNAAQLASALEEHLTQTFSVLEVNLIQQGEKSFSPAASAALTRNARYMRSINLVDASGHVLNSSVDSNIGSRFDSSTLLPKASGPLSVLRVGPLMDGRDVSSARPVPANALAPPQSVIAVQRDVPLAGGGNATMVAALNPDYFLNYYDRHLDLAYGEVALMRMDGSLLLSTAERFTPNAHTDSDIMAMLNRSASGRLHQTTPQGHALLSAYRVSHDFPVVLVVKLDQNQVLQGWLQEVRSTLTVVLTILALALLSSTVYFLRLERLRREHEMRVQDLDNQKYALDQHAIVSITDTAGRITYANERFCAISGYALEELMGQPHSMVKSGQHDPALYAELWRTITQGQVWHGELCNRGKDGALYWVDATIVPLMGVDGLVQQYIAIRTDVTGRKTIEQSLASAKAAAEQANVAKSQFLANMSHEIRTPMNGILGMLEILQGTALTAAQQDYVAKTDGAARLLLGLLNDILDFSKIEAGRMVLEQRPFHLGEVLRNVSGLLGSALGSKPLRLHVAMAPDTPQELIGDDLRLQQILLNLGGNAIKFTEQGEVSIHFRALHTGPDTATLECAVRDSGIGIAPDKQAHVFDSFSQVDASTTRLFGGTGLGLTIARQLVLLMGGDIRLSSQAGEGSCFTFTMTVGVRAATPSLAGPPTVAASGQRLLGLHLLLVEDNPINQVVAQTILKREGAMVTLAENGLLAVDALQRMPSAFDAVLMDLQMPVMDGFAATRAIRQMRGDAALAIIAMTANAMASDRAQCLAAGMDEHVGKPFQIDHLVAVLHAAIGKTHGSRH